MKYRVYSTSQVMLHDGQLTLAAMSDLLSAGQLFAAIDSPDIEKAMQELHKECGGTLLLWDDENGLESFLATQKAINEEKLDWVDASIADFGEIQIYLTQVGADYSSVSLSSNGQALQFIWALKEYAGKNSIWSTLAYRHHDRHIALHNGNHREEPEIPTGASTDGKLTGEAAYHYARKVLSIDPKTNGAQLTLHQIDLDKPQARPDIEDLQPHTRFIKLTVQSSGAVLPSSSPVVQVNEEIEVPAYHIAVFFIRKKFALNGLLSPNCIVHPGWKGRLELTLVHAGASPIELREGDEIGELALIPISNWPTSI